MNRIAGLLVLTAAALATVASSVEVSSAADRHLHRQYVAKPWKKRVVVTGVVTGAMISSGPTIIYREEPLADNDVPLYGGDSIYDDDSLAVAPDDEEGELLYREALPGKDAFAPSAGEDESLFYDEDGGAAEYDENYFPDQPQAQVTREPRATTKLEERTEAAPVRKSNGVKPREEANAAGLRPWSPEWRLWCAKRFPSFNPQNGTYLGYDKKRHFCKASG